MGARVKSAPRLPEIMAPLCSFAQRRLRRRELCLFVVKTESNASVSWVDGRESLDFSWGSWIARNHGARKYARP
ncbi:hypothetical protein BIW11_04107 [Tropilaelaps mercedesae]|uniref:Uncharacterized protein n=1 Tax=Tropilaelaps mercedesae TaxID=418985 RepID=A0A1V9XBL5_9ACAR|nr:hypothetical protein BIW11_04107 [Tropilaelaps mercedesae]